MKYLKIDLNIQNKTKIMKGIYLIGIIILCYTNNLYAQKADCKTIKHFKGFFIHIDPSDTEFLVVEKRIKRRRVLESVYKDSIKNLIGLSDLKVEWNSELYSKGIPVDLSDTVSIVLENSPYLGYLSYGEVYIQCDCNRNEYIDYKGIAKWFEINQKRRIYYTNILNYEKTISIKVIYPKKIKRFFNSKTGKTEEIGN